MNTYRRIDQPAFDPDREKLILDHLQFVENLVARFTAELPPGVDQDNLLSSGILGLVEAARNFDPDRGVSFTTFAYPRIRGAIFDELRRNCPIPQRILKNISILRPILDQFDTPPTLDQLAERTGLDQYTIQECLEALRLTRQESLEGHGYSQSIIGCASPTPDALFEESELHAILNECIGRLPEREQLVIRRYYLENQLLREIGDHICVSESRASRILSRAEERLKQMMERRWKREPPPLTVDKSEQPSVRAPFLNRPRKPRAPWDDDDLQPTG